MLSNRPLFPTLADQELFVWTDGRNALPEALRLGRNTLLLGPRGSGKTSLLHVSEFRLRELEGRPVAFASLAGVDHAAAAIAAIDRAAVEQAWLPAAPDEQQRALRDRDDPFAATALLRRLAAAPTGAIVLLDDVGAAGGAELFGRLRDELWQLGLVWGVAALPGEAGGLLTPPADAFFERRITLADLDEQERRTLLYKRARPDDPDADLDELARSGPGNPRELIALSRDAEENGHSPGALAAAAERRLELAEAAVGRPGTTMVAELADLGPVSAGDETLLDRLGWDRPRAARTLSQLEQAGLVRSYLEPRNGRNGRPRKLYDVAPLADFIPG